jgi:hypothetical protein
MELWKTILTGGEAHARIGLSLKKEVVQQNGK